MSTQPHTIDGKQVECKNAIPKDLMPNNEINGSNNSNETNNNAKFNARKIFVGGLPPNLIENELKEYFEQFGEVSQCLLMFDKNTKKSRGFGFVIYQNENVADLVMNLSLQQKHVIQGKNVNIYFILIYTYF
jgi:RNA recognition motif-containing protein